VRQGEELVVCQACGSVHHACCWETGGGCGSYTCIPARRDPSASATAVWRITAQEIEQAAPLVVVRPPAASIPAPAPPLPRTNRLALASFLCALAGIPLFGVLTGLVAILLGSLSIGALRGTPRKGTWLAVAGIVLGLADVVGWLLFLGMFLWRSDSAVRLEFDRPDLTALENLPGPINRAMRANVLIEIRGGLLQATSLGSGVIVKLADGQAIILTNRHVVDPEFATNPQATPGDKLGNIVLDVTLVDQQVVPGQVMWIAPYGIDLALVRIHGPMSEVRPARWQIGRHARIGDPVFAIGNPLGLGWTHTQGTISQFRLQAAGTQQLRIIQTQTALNPGNSGGGLYDHEGYLLGINTWMRDKRISDGLNFAISLDALTQTAPPGLGLQHRSEEPDQP
jgi:S1-C subfamily serine protease